jgi:hypothetical protein
MATDMHTFLSKRGMAWLYSRGFRMCATEVRFEWGSKRRRDGQPHYEENADACGVGIIDNLDARCCVLEVKVSRGDFLSDQKKEHRSADNPYVTERYYLAPAGLLKSEEMPERWGLLEYHEIEDKIYVAKRAKRRKLAHLTKEQHFHGNTPPWKIPLEPDIVGGVALWGSAWAAVVERGMNVYRFGSERIQIHPKPGKGRKRRPDRSEYTVDRDGMA